MPSPGEGETRRSLANRIFERNFPMHLKTLAPATKMLLDQLTPAPWLNKYYLAGGTALALHYGHRQSVDLDWFTPEHIQIPSLLKNLSKIAPVEILNRTTDTLEGIIAGVKVSFMTYPYPLLKKPTRYDGAVVLAQPLDIVLMKLGAIADRNTKKDFIDLYIFLEREQKTLSDLLDYLPQKFKGVNYDRYHLYKALTYFIEADAEVLPKMLVKVDWKQIKRFFITDVKKLV